MDSAFENFSPNPNNWFNRDVEYQGWGHAEFLDPKGFAEGPSRVFFDGTNRLCIEMEVEKYEVDCLPNARLFELTCAAKFFHQEGSISFGLGEVGKNVCTSLSIQTDNGEFLVDGGFYYYRHEFIFNNELKFLPKTSHFRANNKEKPHYWVLPLLNFLTSFDKYYSQLADHPLRLYSTPSIPDNLPEQTRNIAIWTANSKNQLIVFDFAGNQAFIEPIYDYENQKKQLLENQTSSAITSLMVGQIPLDIAEDADTRWLPYEDFLLILSFATAIKVGIPWIELRDAEGQLVQRIHGNLAHPSFSKGYSPIPNNSKQLEHLLNQAQHSNKFGSHYLRIAIRQTIKGARYNQDIADKLIHLFLAINSLLKEYKCEQITEKPVLSEGIVSKLKEASEEATNLALKAKNKNSGEEKFLNKIARQIMQSQNVKANFGDSIVTLLKNFDLLDAIIIDQYYKKASSPQTWPDILAKYRGIVMHGDTFDYSKEYVSKDTIRIAFHLYDLLCRIILKALGYEDIYRSYIQVPMNRDPLEQSLNWVTQATLPEDIGYL